MKCADLRERMVDFLYDELAPRDRADFDEHARACPACRAEVESHRRVLGQARQALAGPLAQEPPRRVHAAVLAAAAQAARRTARGSDKDEPGFLARFWRTPWFLPAFGAVSVATVVFLVKVLKDPEVMPGQRPGSGDEIHLAPATVPMPRAPAAEPAAPGAAREDGASVPASAERRFKGAGKRARAAAETEASGKARARTAPPPFIENVDQGAGAGFAQPPRNVRRSARDLDDLAKAATPRPPAKRDVELAPASPAKGERDELSADNEPMARQREYAAPPPARLPAAQPPPPAPAVATPPPSARYAPAPAAEAAPAELSAQEGMEPASKAKAKADRGASPPGPSLDDSVRQAERLFADGNWSGAGQAYRELLRRFPSHRDAPRWRQRIEQAMLAEEQTRRADEAKAAKARRP